jgi:hypothetical protein
MTLLSQYLHIHFQFIYLLISSNFKLYFILTSNESTLFFKHRGKTFTFLFAPCVPSTNPWFTLSVIPSSVFVRFCCHLLLYVAIVSLIIPICCHLFQCVALCFLSVPLSFKALPSTPSLCFVQRAAAFLLSNDFIDPHA